MFAKRIGIDLGSSNLRVAVRGEGGISTEPSVAAVERETGEILAVGQAAIDAHDRDPAGVAAVRPVRQGVVRDLAVTEGILRQLVARAQGRQRLFKPEVLICVSAASTSVERRGLVHAAIAAGARQAWLLEAPLAVAIGAGVRVVDARPQAVCEVGGGKTEVGVVARSGLVAADSLAGGGDRLDAAIAAHLYARYGLLVGRGAAEQLKLAAGAALPIGGPLAARVAGETVAGRRRTVVVTSEELAEALREPLAAIAGAVLEVLRQLPAAEAEHARRRGLLLAGGGARLRGLDRYLAREVGGPVQLVDEPATCGVRGARRALGEFEVLRRRQLYLH